LQQLVEQIAARIGHALERRGLVERDLGSHPQGPVQGFHGRVSAASV
jgi:hypothetical protein